jgi:putative ABC transport system ATP-binding protein
MRTILEAENLEKVYRIGKVDVPALRGVSLEVQEGEFVAIMGPSGCGKSTMLHLLGGLLTPTSGRIVIDGEDITAASDAKRTSVRRKKIGFVFQRFNLFPTLTAEGNLRLAERIHGNGGEDPGRRREVLKLLGLEDKLHHKPLATKSGIGASSSNASGDRSRGRTNRKPRFRELCSCP